MANKLPITALVMTKNEAGNIVRCLRSLDCCQKVIVVDSFSSDKTAKIAEQYGAKVMPFEWNRQYPKKRQWSLDNIPIRTPWVFFVDADEVVSSSLRNELERLMKKNKTKDAYFVSSFNVWKDKLLRHGRLNSKIVLFKKGTVFFPNMYDEEELNMGEIEGHYQPFVKGAIGRLQKPLIHYGPNDKAAWLEKHRRYARWMAWMIVNGHQNKLFNTEKGLRKGIKSFFLWLPFKPLVAFIDSFILKFGFLDGTGGFCYAILRARYYIMIRQEILALRKTKD